MDKSQIEADAILILEARFKRVVRKGKVVKKQMVKKGFKLVRKKGGGLKAVRQSPTEKRRRAMAMKRAWRQGKQARLVKAKRVLKRSQVKRKAIFGR